jgi:transposase InsO family protein
MADEGFLGFLGRIAGTFAGGTPEGPKNAWQALSSWGQDFTRNASTVWLPKLVLGIPCDLSARGHRCPNAAAATCVICGSPVCLEHCFVSRAAEVACFVCIHRSVSDFSGRSPGVGSPPPPREKPPPKNDPPPPPRAVDPTLTLRLRSARKLLGVKPGTPRAELDQRYKKLLATWHPDRHPQDRARAEERFKAIRSAYDLLIQTYAESPRP